MVWRSLVCATKTVYRGIWWLIWRLLLSASVVGLPGKPLSCAVSIAQPWRTQETVSRRNLKFCGWPTEVVSSIYLELALHSFVRALEVMDQNKATENKALSPTPNGLVGRQSGELW